MAKKQRDVATRTNLTFATIPLEEIKNTLTQPPMDENHILISLKYLNVKMLISCGSK